ncbi:MULTISPECIES: hypothetical protein [unclassified Moorena]|uniref:hypothetical protein n=1 Tax=unclassified Moorena TaxID=2683338 RepID=UPI0014003DA5|nr:MULTISPECIES: hypothetical protein [unclassified Moorena]NEO13118.1 hypothetical protein [Moorena sp. SIO3E8]NEP98136.1 hypothetical protein [Moorena sp. SIO3F7]
MWRGLIINNVDYEHIINTQPWLFGHATETTYPSPKAKGEQLSPLANRPRYANNLHPSPLANRPRYANNLQHFNLQPTPFTIT